MIDLARLTDSLIRHEGLVLHAYPDKLSYTTIGIGTCIDERVGAGITRDEALYLCHNRITRADAQCKSLAWFLPLDPVRQNVICELMFAMSPLKISRFIAMNSAIQARNWNRAAAELLNSDWARTVGQRAVTLAKMLQTGEWPSA